MDILFRFCQAFLGSLAGCTYHMANSPALSCFNFSALCCFFLFSRWCVRYDTVRFWLLSFFGDVQRICCLGKIQCLGRRSLICSVSRGYYERIPHPPPPSPPPSHTHCWVGVFWLIRRSMQPDDVMSWCLWLVLFWLTGGLGWSTQRWCCAASAPCCSSSSSGAGTRKPRLRLTEEQVLILLLQSNWVITTKCRTSLMQSGTKIMWHNVVHALTCFAFCVLCFPREIKVQYWVPH